MSSPATNIKATEAKIKELRVEEQKEPYPTPRILFAENEESEAAWDTFFQKTPLSERREDYAARGVINHSMIDCHSTENEDLLVADKESGAKVHGVYQNLLSDPELVALVDSFVVEYSTRALKTVRVHDPGMIFNIGETGGNRNNRVFGTATNLKVLTGGKMVGHMDDLELNYAMACLLSHIWNAAKNVLPEEVVKHYDHATAKLGGMGMGSVLLGSDKVLQYTLKLGNRDQHVKSESLAPSGGIPAINYGRHIHKERNMNTYCVSYTTHRSHDASFGGNFINATYGTYIPNRADQLIFWCAQDYHGTTLPVVDPEDEHPIVQTRGIGFIMSESFPAAYKNYLVQTSKEDTSRTGDMPEYIRSGLVLANSGAQPGPLKNLEKRTGPKNGVQKVSNNSRVWGKKLPTSHAYQNWKNEALWNEIQKRRANGTNMRGAKDWPKRDLQKALLVHDGVELEDGEDDIRTRY